MQTGKTQPPCGSVGTLPAPQVWFSHSSDLPALPIMRFTISQSAQWKSGPKNLNHSIKFIVKIIIIRKEDNCHWHGFLFVLQNFFFTEYKLCMTWDSGKEFGRFRRFLFCFLFIRFSKHPFCFHCALKRMRKNSGSRVKRERRILELRSLANPFSVKICVLFCAVMKRWKEKNCPTLSTTRPAKRTSDSRSEAHPTAGLFPSLLCCQTTLSENGSVPAVIVRDLWVRSCHGKSI